MKSVKSEKVKTTLRFYKFLWQAVQHRAIQEETTAEAIVTQALVQFLGLKPGDFQIAIKYARAKKGGK